MLDLRLGAAGGAEGGGSFAGSFLGDDDKNAEGDGIVIVSIILGRRGQGIEADWGGKENTNVNQLEEGGRVHATSTGKGHIRRGGAAHREQS